MLHELTLCLGSSYWLNISFCWVKPEWQRQEETPPLIIPPSLPLFTPPSLHLFIPHPSLCSSIHPSSLCSSLHPSLHHPYFPLSRRSPVSPSLLILHPSPSPPLPHPRSVTPLRPSCYQALPPPGLIASQSVPLTSLLFIPPSLIPSLLRSILPLPLSSPLHFLFARPP